MAAVGVKGLIENFSEGIAPDPIGSYWGGAGAPQPLQRPSPNLNPRSVLLPLPPLPYDTIRYDTIEEINVDSKAEYTA